MEDKITLLKGRLEDIDLMEEKVCRYVQYNHAQDFPKIYNCKFLESHI